MYRAELLDKMNIVATSKNESGYNYYGYTSRFDGAWVIMRENTVGTEYLYAVGTKDFTAKWAIHATLTYQRPDQFNAACRN